MELSLSAEEVRVLGALLEKKMATPEYYPLSLNTLLNACNQKVNRLPVVTYDEPTVLQAIQRLRTKSLLWINTSGRVDKYREGLVELLELSEDQAAVLCLLLLRGPQTLGEIRGRSERLYLFSDLDAVQTTLDTLSDLELVEQAARQPGQKEQRFCHLLAPALESSGSQNEMAPEPITVSSAEQDRIGVLEDKVQGLTLALAELEQAFSQFKQQFE